MDQAAVEEIEVSGLNHDFCFLYSLPGSPGAVGIALDASFNAFIPVAIVDRGMGAFGCAGRVLEADQACKLVREA